VLLESILICKDASPRAHDQRKLTPSPSSNPRERFNFPAAKPPQDGKRESIDAGE